MSAPPRPGEASGVAAASARTWSESAPLAPRTTLGIGGSCVALAEVRDAAEVLAWRTFAAAKGWPIAVLGGGSNTIVSDAGWPGLVLVPASCALATWSQGDGVHVRAGAGLPWDELVAWSVRRELAGIAALSGIPGRVGAAPVQNIGAYGEQLQDVFVAAEVVDLASGSVAVWTGADAAFAYRDSAWKRAGAGRHVITWVELRLRPTPTVAARYPDLRAALAQRGIAPDAAPLAALRRAVLDVRRSKGMVVDPECADSRSLGSFFVNPIVPDEVADAAEARLRAAAATWAAEGAVAALAPFGRPVAPRWPMPRFGADPGRVKLSAAWLIEATGWRKGDGCDGPATEGANPSSGDGLGPGAVGLSSRHVLALVHRQGGDARTLLAFADRIATSVAAATGVALEREPVGLGEPGDLSAPPPRTT